MKDIAREPDYDDVFAALRSIVCSPERLDKLEKGDFMEKSILLILVGDRKKSAVEVQKILTEMGCFVKTRLGIHDGAPDACANTGLIILELVGSGDEKESVVRKLNALPSVSVELVTMSLKDAG